MHARAGPVVAARGWLSVGKMDGSALRASLANCLGTWFAGRCLALRIAGRDGSTHGLQHRMPVTTAQSALFVLEQPSWDCVAPSVPAPGVHEFGVADDEKPHVPPTAAARMSLVWSVHVLHPPLRLDAFITQQPAAAPWAAVTVARSALSAALVEQMCHPVWHSAAALAPLLTVPVNVPEHAAIFGCPAGGVMFSRVPSAQPSCLHVDEQPSPLTRFPSSQNSPVAAVSTPSPQTPATQLPFRQIWLAPQPVPLLTLV